MNGKKPKRRARFGNDAMQLAEEGNKKSNGTDGANEGVETDGSQGLNERQAVVFTSGGEWYLKGCSERILSGPSRSDWNCLHGVCPDHAAAVLTLMEHWGVCYKISYLTEHPESCGCLPNDFAGHLLGLKAENAVRGHVVVQKYMEDIRMDCTEKDVQRLCRTARAHRTRTRCILF